MQPCLVIQHVEPEKPYAIAEALHAAGIPTDIRITTSDSLPESTESYCGLVVMGGPMSAHLDEGFPTRRAEISLLSEALSTNTPVLGVCLGAQLLAAAAGAQVFSGEAGPEIGWAAIELTEASSEDPLFRDCPKRMKVLHWHGDTFELPSGSAHLARSAKYQAQAFRVGRWAWGLQFHIEIDQSALEAFLYAFGAEATKAGSPPESMLAVAPAALETLRPIQSKVFSRFAEVLGGYQ